MEHAGFNIWDFWVMIFGVVCLAATASAAIYFWQHRKNPMGLAIFVDMVAEFSACLFALIFSIDAAVDHNLDPDVRGIMRVLIFVCLVASSIHLAYQTRKTIVNNEDK